MLRTKTLRSDYSNPHKMLSSFGSMDKMILLVLIFVGRSYQRPQLELDASNTTETSDATTTEETKSSEKITRVTETPAVSVQTSVNVSSYVPGEVYEDFKPSNYYRPDGDPIFERPSPQVTHEVFYGSERFKRPNDLAYRRPSPLKPDDKNIVFPQATQVHVLHSNRSNGPQSRSPNKFTETITAHTKPLKHDYGEAVPSFSHYDDNFYEKNFGNYYGNEMSHYPDLIHEPPKPYHHHDVTTRKKKDPWRNMLSVLATILPVGLLLASFPPTVIKVNSTQYPYQFQRNATSYNPDIIVGRYKALKKKKTRSKINEGDESSRNLDDCLKRKLCESIKTNYSPSELDSVLQNSRSNPTNNSPNAMLEIAKAAVSTSPESCQVFVCSN